METPKYKRILLKVSGEALAGAAGRGLDQTVVGRVCDAIARAVGVGTQVGVVVGGGNFWRGLKDGGDRMQRSRADYMGMLATTINALDLADALQQRGVDAVVQTAIPMAPVAEPFDRNRAVAHLEQGRVVIFGCGTGNPYFSTDTAAVLRSLEIGADILLMAKNVDGVYSADPKTDPNAVRYDSITYDTILKDHLSVIDFTAASLALDNKLPVMLFALSDPDNIVRAVKGDKVGTVVKV